MDTARKLKKLLKRSEVEVSGDVDERIWDDVRERAERLLKQDRASRRLVIGMTEMGSYGITDDATERLFKDGMRAVMDAIDDQGVY